MTMIASGKRLATCGAIAIAAAMGISGCSKDDGAAATSEPAATQARGGSSAKKSSAGKVSDSAATAHIRTSVLANPTTCTAGKNKRKLGSVRIGKREPGKSDAGEYLKVYATASITETGPCKETAGKHSWNVAATFLLKDRKWQPAGFGFDQSRVK